MRIVSLTLQCNVTTLRVVSYYARVAHFCSTYVHLCVLLLFTRISFFFSFFLHILSDNFITGRMGRIVEFESIETISIGEFNYFHHLHERFV